MKKDYYLIIIDVTPPSLTAHLTIYDKVFVYVSYIINGSNRNINENLVEYISFIAVYVSFITVYVLDITVYVSIITVYISFIFRLSSFIVDYISYMTKNCIRNINGDNRKINE